MASSTPPSRPTPRGGDRRGPLGSRPGASIWYALGFVLLLGLVQMYFLTPPGRPMPYSEFKAQLKSGNVTEVTVGDQTIRGTLKEALPSSAPGPVAGTPTKQFTTNRVDDPKLTEELENQRADELELIEADTEVEITGDNETITIRPVKARYSLDDLLSGVTSENIHDEVDTGTPVGKEAW